MSIEAAPDTDAIIVTIVEDHPLIIQGLQSLVSGSGTDVLLHTRSLDSEPTTRSHVTLFDLHGPVAADPEGLAQLLGDPRNGMVLHYSWPRGDDRTEARRLGFAGFLSKAAGQEEVLATLHCAAGVQHGEGPSGWPTCESLGLTTRESEILQLIGQGLRNEEICARLFLSINTVKTYIRNAYRKIGVARRAQAVLWVSTHGHLVGIRDSHA